MGDRANVLAYDRTRTASIYVWWGVCGLVSDIEAITMPANARTGNDQYFDQIPDFFLALWYGLVDALHSDVERQLRCHPRYEIDHM